MEALLFDLGNVVSALTSLNMRQGGGMRTSWERAACFASLPGLEKAKAFGFWPGVACAAVSLD